MNDYTPDDYDVRSGYVELAREACITNGLHDHGSEFDRWLRQVKAGAWDECADWTDIAPYLKDNNPYRGDVMTGIPEGGDRG